MNRLAYAILTGLVGAGLVHIAVILLVPWFSSHDAWSRLSAVTAPFQFVAISDPAELESFLVNDDPLIRTSACRADIAAAPVRVTSDGRVPFWSIAVYDRRGINLFSYNDRTSSDAFVDLVLATSAQAIEIAKAADPELARSIIAEVKSTELVVAVRVFQPDASMSEEIADFLQRLGCDPI